MNDVKFFICAMSKNIINAVIGLNDPRFGLIASRRQIDYNGGYVGLNTRQFYEHVHAKITIQRDHGGENQGIVLDNGWESYKNDAQYMDIIHIDPWKSVFSLEEGLTKTLNDINFIHGINPSCKFEVGTEEAIFPFTSKSLLWFLSNLEKNLSTSAFEQIEYVVIQSGVGLNVVSEVNSGMFSKEKLETEISICRRFGKKSKEHNGDFLDNEQKKIRFQTGLSAVNIGPEISIFENKLYLEIFSEQEIISANRKCYTEGNWKKWVTQNNFDEYFRITGHYIYNDIQLPNIEVIPKLQNKLLTLTHSLT